MTRPWIVVVGIGEEGLDGLGENARRRIAEAEVLVGGRRHLGLVPESRAERVLWRSPLADTFAEIEARAHRQIVVLASGDPLWYGVGRSLIARFGREAVEVVPHVSAFQLACARLGWPLEDTLTLSLHGRPLALLLRHLQPGRRLLLLTSDGAAPSAIGRRLVDAGFAASSCHVLAHLGGRHEQAWSGTAEELARSPNFTDLNVVAVHCRADPDSRSLPRIAGLDDDVFLHDGTVTKAEVRAVAVAALLPMPGLLLWDIGAGAGSIAIEWLRCEPTARAIAVELRSDRIASIRANAERLGAPDLEVVEGRAPEVLSNLADPDRIFLGGGVAEPGLLDYLAARLRAGGRLVAHAVTIEGEAALLAFAEGREVRLRRIAVSRAETRHGHRLWRALAPVTQLVWEKR